MTRLAMEFVFHNPEILVNILSTFYHGGEKNFLYAFPEALILICAFPGGNSKRNIHLAVDGKRINFAK